MGKLTKTSSIYSPLSCQGKKSASHCICEPAQTIHSQKLSAISKIRNYLFCSRFSYQPKHSIPSIKLIFFFNMHVFQIDFMMQDNSSYFALSSLLIEYDFGMYEYRIQLNWRKNMRKICSPIEFLGK